MGLVFHSGLLVDTLRWLLLMEYAMATFVSLLWQIDPFGRKLYK